MISNLLAAEYQATNMLQLYTASSFLGGVKQYTASATNLVEYETGEVYYRSIWVTFYKKSMRIDFDQVAVVDIPFVFPIYEMSKILQNEMHIMTHKQCYFK